MTSQPKNPPDPAELLPPTVPDAVLDALVADLRTLQRDATLDLALAMGELIVERIYAGDLAAWRDRGVKDASFRKLSKRLEDAEIPGLSAAGLSRAVGVWELEQRVGLTRRPQLNVSHARAVLGLQDAQQERLLGMAEAKDWTADRLEREVARIRKRDGGGKGRPPLPAFVKGVNQLERMLADDAFADLDRVDGLPAQERTRMRASVAAMKAQCDALLTALGEP